MPELGTQKKKPGEDLWSTPGVVFGLLAVVALLLTFTVSNLSLSFETRTLLFGLVLAGYVATVLAFVFLREPEDGDDTASQDPDDGIFTRETEEKLRVLEEAGEFFGASLRSEDMFRLIASRVGELVSYDSCVFLVLDADNRLSYAFSAGKNAKQFRELSIDCDRGLPGKAFASRAVEIEDWNGRTPAPSLPPAISEGLLSAAAVPLVRGGEVFAVMLLLSASAGAYGKRSRILLEATAERITPLITSTFSFERSLSNALTDVLTDLPNERAFYLVLENQLAEAHRFRGERSLAVLAVDIRDFAELNRKYGHGVGDDVLAFVAKLIKRQLRQMDLVARMQNDEFIIILPTANAETANTVMNRIGDSVRKAVYKLPDDPRHRIEVDLGAAVFDRDGDTAAKLVQNAVLRKTDSGSGESRHVLFFPTKETD